MKIIEHEYATVDLSELRQHPRNPRRGDVAAIRKSIRKNGWYGVIVAQKSTGNILAGNHRYLAAKREGAKSAPVVWVDVDDATALRILLVDNRANDLAEYDDDCLAELLDEINDETGSLAGTGYDDRDLQKLLKELAADPEDDADDQTDELLDQWQVVVECRTEEEQTELLTRLAGEGFSCKALVA